MGIFGLMTKKDFDREVSEVKQKAQDAIDNMRTRRSTTYMDYGDDYLYGRYKENGFLQTIVEAPADDAVRQWFKIEPLGGGQEGIPSLIQDRLEKLKIKKLLREAIKFSRIYPKGALLFLGIKGSRENSIKDQTDLKNPLPASFANIDYINLIADPDKFAIDVPTTQDPTKKGYNEPIIKIGQTKIHPSRYLWFCNEFNPKAGTGISVVQKLLQAVGAQEGGVESISRVLQALQFFLVNDEAAAQLPAEKKAEFLAAIKNYLKTNGAVVLGKDGKMEFKGQQAGSGLKDIFEIIWEVLSGSARIPKSILLGKAHGFVTAGEYDTISYYDSVGEYQETELRPKLRHVIDLVLRETSGPVYKATQGKFEYKIKFNPLWKLAPDEQAKLEKNNAGRDQIDIRSGKITPNEAREMDPRTQHLDELPAGELDFPDEEGAAD